MKNAHHHSLRTEGKPQGAALSKPPSPIRRLENRRSLEEIDGCLQLRLSVLSHSAFWLFLPKPSLTGGIDFSTRVRDRNGNVLRVTLTADQKYRIWTPLRDISPSLINATVRFEDKYFARHPGVNPVPLFRAAWNFARSGHPRAGASTITMQLARLRFHLHTRTLGGKLRQILYALELERHYSKNEILEAYLNLAPYGRNIEGAGAASEIYFGKTAARLSGTGGCRVEFDSAKSQRAVR